MTLRESNLLKVARLGLGGSQPPPVLPWPPAIRSQMIKIKEIIFFKFFAQEDLECGVCTSGSSCDLGWGAKVDPISLDIKLGPRQPGVSLVFPSPVFNLLPLTRGV